MLDPYLRFTEQRRGAVSGYFRRAWEGLHVRSSILWARSRQVQGRFKDDFSAKLTVDCPSCVLIVFIAAASHQESSSRLKILVFELLTCPHVTISHPRTVCAGLRHAKGKSLNQFPERTDAGHPAAQLSVLAICPQHQPTLPSIVILESESYAMRFIIG